VTDDMYATEDALRWLAGTLGVDDRVATAILTIAASDEIGAFTHVWVRPQNGIAAVTVTGGDDAQAFRIKTRTQEFHDAWQAERPASRDVVLAAARLAATQPGPRFDVTLPPNVLTAWWWEMRRVVQALLAIIDDPDNWIYR
jgi:hypothetical protein